MSAILGGRFTSVLSVTNRDELLVEVLAFARHLGFELVNAMAVIDRPSGESEFLRVDNTPAAYREAFENFDNAARDPVMQHCKRVSRPIVWNQHSYTAVGQGEKWEAQASFGYRTGIALALHLSEGRHFCIGFDREQELPSSTAELTRMTADLLLFAVHAQDVALSVLSPSMPQCDIPRLTPRELECLRWTMDGKTAWEVGRILGISEQTAVRHVNNAMHKLGCVNKHQAVLKAFRMDLIR